MVFAATAKSKATVNRMTISSASTTTSTSYGDSTLSVSVPDNSYYSCFLYAYATGDGGGAGTAFWKLVEGATDKKEVTATIPNDVSTNKHMCWFNLRQNTGGAQTVKIQIKSSTGKTTAVDIGSFLYHSTVNTFFEGIFPIVSGQIILIDGGVQVSTIDLAIAPGLNARETIQTTVTQSASEKVSIGSVVVSSKSDVETDANSMKTITINNSLNKLALSALGSVNANAIIVIGDWAGYKLTVA